MEGLESGDWSHWTGELFERDILFGMIGGIAVVVGESHGLVLGSIWN